MVQLSELLDSLVILHGVKKDLKGSPISFHRYPPNMNKQSGPGFFLIVGGGMSFNVREKG